jgi:hypothetical protein
MELMGVAFHQFELVDDSLHAGDAFHGLDNRVALVGVLQAAGERDVALPHGRHHTRLRRRARASQTLINCLE